MQTKKMKKWLTEFEQQDFNSHLNPTNWKIRNELLYKHVEKEEGLRDWVLCVLTKMCQILLKVVGNLKLNYLGRAMS